MDDKPPELAALLEKVNKTIEMNTKAISDVTANNADLAKIIQDFKEQQNAWFQREITRLGSVSQVSSSQLLAGRFARRDGDGFATVPRKFGSADPENADGTARNLRPPE